MKSFGHRSKILEKSFNKKSSKKKIILHIKREYKTKTISQKQLAGQNREKARSGGGDTGGVKVKRKRTINWRRVITCLMMMALGVLMFAFPTFATSGGGSGDGSAATLMTNLINLMCSMFKFVGAAIFVWAVIQFVLATKRSDADSKADAVQTAVCGIALVSIAAIINNLGIGNAIGTGSDFDSSSLDNVGSGGSH